MSCTTSLDRKIRNFTESIAVRTNALPADVTTRKPPGSVGTKADVNLCNSGVGWRSNNQKPNASYKQWDGSERRTTHLVVERERRTGVSYLSTTPDFITRAEQVRQALMNVAPESLRLKPLSEAMNK